MFALSPPSINHLPERYNNQTKFNEWWTWRLYIKFGGNKSPPRCDIPCEPYSHRIERYKLWREVANQADQYELQK